MVSFAGWEMAIQFSGLIDEHQAVRKDVGIFDISHMGVLLIKGNKAKESLQNLVPSDLFRIGPGEACYTVLLNHEAGIIDDLIIYDLGVNHNNQESLILVVNASRLKEDLNWINSNLSDKEIEISDHKSGKALLAIQGPNSQTILEDFLQTSLNSIPYFGHKCINLNLQELKVQNEIFIARTGYTGEKGFECLLPAKAAQILWESLIAKGVKPCGLGSRDTLRLEAGMHLYGNDLNEKTTPFEAGLGWLVHLEMPFNFIGRQALENQAKEGIKTKLVGLKMKGRAIARKWYSIISANKIIGTITSGTWSPSLKEAIAFGYIPKELSSIGTKLHVEIRGKHEAAEIVKKPFFKKID